MLETRLFEHFLWLEHCPNSPTKMVVLGRRSILLKRSDFPSGPLDVDLVSGFERKMLQDAPFQPLDIPAADITALKAADPNSGVLCDNSNNKPQEIPAKAVALTP